MKPTTKVKTAIVNVWLAFGLILTGVVMIDGLGGLVAAIGCVLVPICATLEIRDAYDL